MLSQAGSSQDVSSQAVSVPEPPAAAHVLRGATALSSLSGVLGQVGPRLRGRAVVVPALSQPAPADPAVVEELVDLLVEGGCAHVVVAGALTTTDRDRGHRGVEMMAATAGHRGRTRRGRQYQVLDLHADLVEAPVPASSVLSGAAVSGEWVRADLRVVVGRSRTDAADGYAGCLDTLLTVLPSLDGADPADVAADLLAHLPPALAVVDALVSSHGPDGRHVLLELATEALVVAGDALAADCALSALQGQDRAASRLVRRALQRSGPPQQATAGDLSPFPGFVAPHPLVRDGVRRAGAAPQLARVLAAATGGPDRGSGPTDPLLAGVRSLLTPLVAAADEPSVRPVLFGLLAGAAAVGEQLDGWAATAAKHRARRVLVPLGFDPDAWDGGDYDELPRFLAPVAELAAAQPAGPDGLRWCYLDEAVVFETQRVVAAPFDEFVARVDVAEGIGLMADYLGGRRVPVTTDERGRVVRQAERNVYLPQPNYLAHWGGTPIDVCKIELVERRPGMHRLLWRTVESPNRSATFDDGSLTFTDTGDGRTRLSVSGRQLFTLPLFWQAVDLDRVPEVKDRLVEEAYRRFFTTSFDNLEACYEGRDFRIGRDPESSSDPLVTRVLQQLLSMAAGWMAQPAGGTVAAPEVDVHGFRHFTGPTAGQR